MKREEVLAVLDAQHDELLSAGNFSGEGCWFHNGQEEEVMADYAKARAFIASALDDAERYRWLRNEAHPDSDDSGLAVMLQDFNDWGKSYFKHFSGDALDAAIDTARAAAAGGEG